MWELVLRLYTLSTLAHEVAHHFDYSVRVARGRWRADEKEAKELFARQQEYDWLQTYVIPYLEETYPLEVEKLNNWMHEKLGIVLPLVLVAGDPRTRVRGNGITNAGLWGTTSAFQEFATVALKNTGLNTARFELAQNLHRNEHNEVAYEILEVILKELPEDIKVLILKAEVLTELGLYTLASETLNTALSIDLNNIKVWLQATQTARVQSDWPGVINAASRGLALNQDGWMPKFLAGYRARAFLELGRFQEAQADIDYLFAVGMKSYTRQAEHLQFLKEFYLRQ